MKLIVPGVAFYIQLWYMLSTCLL